MIKANFCNFAVKNGLFLRETTALVEDSTSLLCYNGHKGDKNKLYLISNEQRF